ncbi:MAG: hypothetical protein QGG53_35610, partial [Planctomycetota bacterium]|nr:hypothetical protein [Planctomycetota bacterium]
ADEEMFFQPIWLGEREQIVALAVRGSKELEIIRIDLSSGQSRLIKSMVAEEADVALMVPPVLVQQRYLFFSAELEAEGSPIRLYRFDLKKEELQAVPKGQEHYLFRFGPEYLYIASHEKGMELGRLDTKSTRFKRLMVLDEQKYGQLTAGLATRKNGKELAVVVKHQREQGEKKSEILILNRRGKIMKRIPLPEDRAFDESLHMAYGPRELSLWIPHMTSAEPNGKSKEYVLSLLEVDVEKGRFSEILAARVSEDGSKRAMQPSISPDGKYLAVNVLLPKDEKNSLLYLVDLTTPERKVTKVSLSPKPAPTEAQ